MTLARAIHARPRLVRALQDAVRASRASASSHHPLHGRLGPASIFRAPGSDVAYVAGWLDATIGPATLDVGCIVGDLAECASTALLLGGDRLAVAVTAAIRELAAGYAASPHPLPALFPAAVADVAALKIVEHVARFTRHIGDSGSSAFHLLTAAESLLHPDGWLIDALSTH